MKDERVGSSRAGQCADRYVVGHLRGLRALLGLLGLHGLTVLIWPTVRPEP